MTPRPPTWMSTSSTPCPTGLSARLMSTGDRPVTHTADVERKAASTTERPVPSPWQAGRHRASVPSRIMAAKEMAGHVRGVR